MLEIVVVFGGFSTPPIYLGTFSSFGVSKIKYVDWIYWISVLENKKKKILKFKMVVSVKGQSPKTIPKKMAKLFFFNCKETTTLINRLKLDREQGNYVDSHWNFTKLNYHVYFNFYFYESKYKHPKIKFWYRRNQISWTITKSIY